MGNRQKTGKLKQALKAQYASKLQRAHMEAQDKALNDVSQILEENEARITELEQALKDANDKLAELQHENVRLRQALEKVSANSQPVESEPMISISQGTAHKEWYEGEQHDLIISILTETLKSGSFGLANTRAGVLLSDILANNDYVGIGREKFLALKKILTNSGCLSNSDCSLIEELGFRVELMNSGHYVFYYKGYRKQHPVTIPATPSDKRSGKNVFSDICNNLSVYKNL
ncbi:MAG: hypothetical protein II875_13515 [Clostridia bacterium]|nr:hypothetical protein [Clostridia bacterium]